MLKLWLFRTFGIPDFSSMAYDMHDYCGQWDFDSKDMFKVEKVDCGFARKNP